METEDQPPRLLDLVVTLIFCPSDPGLLAAALLSAGGHDLRDADAIALAPAPTPPVSEAPPPLLFIFGPLG